MDTETLLGLAVIAFVVGSTLYVSGRSFLRALRARREQLMLTRSGVPAHGTVSRVHPLERRFGHTVTVNVQDPHGHRWEAVDSTGLSGYLVHEGTPVDVLYVPAEPHLVRVEYAAHPGPSHSRYPVHPDRQPGEGLSWLLPLVPIAAVLASSAIFITVMSGGEGLVSFVPYLFIVVGLGLVVGGTVSTVRIRMRARRRTATATGTITDTWVDKRRARSGRSSRTSQTSRTYPFTVHFGSRDGRQVHSRYRISSSAYAPTVGGPVSVRYDPEFPVNFTVSGITLNPAFGGCVTLVLGVGFTVFGSFMVFVIAVG